MNILDLYCGIGGWAQGFVEQGHDVTGYDIVDFSKQYPGKFIQADLLAFNDFPDADVIVASPPCTDFPKADLPQSWPSVRKHPPDVDRGIALFNRVYEIVNIVKPKYFIIKNVRGAQKFMGKAVMHIGSRYFWGDFPLFSVGDAKDIYGKWKMPPSVARPILRSKIPLSISRSFSRAVTGVKK